jgi:hypothetical protein
MDNCTKGSEPARKTARCAHDGWSLAEGRFMKIMYSLVRVLLAKNCLNDGTSLLVHASSKSDYK